MTLEALTSAVMLARTSVVMLACIDRLLDRPLVWWCWLILDPPHSWSWRDRSGPCGLWMRRSFRCEAGRLVLTNLDYLDGWGSEGQIGMGSIYMAMHLPC